MLKGIDMEIEKVQIVAFKVTSALDPGPVDEVNRVMNTLAQQSMTMSIVPCPCFVKDIAGHVVVMVDGLVAEAGLPARIVPAAQETRAGNFLQQVFND